MRASVFSLMGLLIMLVVLYVGYKFGSRIPILNGL